MINSLNPRPQPNPIPTSWNLNKHSDYHQNVGRTTDNCIALRHTIQELIDLKINLDPSIPNVARNPLPNHPVNAIREDNGLPDSVLLI